MPNEQTLPANPASEQPPHNPNDILRRMLNTPPAPRPKPEPYAPDVPGK